MTSSLNILTFANVCCHFLFLQSIFAVIKSASAEFADTLVLWLVCRVCIVQIWDFMCLMVGLWLKWRTLDQCRGHIWSKTLPVTTACECHRRQLPVPHIMNHTLSQLTGFKIRWNQLRLTKPPLVDTKWKHNHSKTWIKKVIYLTDFLYCLHEPRKRTKAQLISVMWGLLLEKHLNWSKIITALNSWHACNHKYQRQPVMVPNHGEILSGCV